MTPIKEHLTAKSTKSTFVVFALDEMYHLTAASCVATATVEYRKHAKQKRCMPENDALRNRDEKQKIERVCFPFFFNGPSLYN